MISLDIILAQMVQHASTIVYWRCPICKADSVSTKLSPDAKSNEPIRVVTCRNRHVETTHATPSGNEVSTYADAPVYPPFGYGVY